MPTRRGIAIVIASYLLGGISTGYYLVRLTTGEDVRQSGSGSSGARNVGRALGKRGFAITAAGDIAKGAAIPCLVRATGGSEVDIARSSVAAVAGHIWPAQLGFRGGRGLTVAFGAVLATEPRVGIAALGVAGSLLPVVHDVTGAGLTATAGAPVLARFLGSSSSAVRGIAGMAAIVLIGHRHYIRQALANRDNPFSNGAA
jgi:glycerol-3-phosphate acyltransferase PlsY